MDYSGGLGATGKDDVNFFTGEGASEVISHPAPVFWIHSPVLLARLAIQSARKTGWRRGAKAPAEGDVGMRVRPCTR